MATMHEQVSRENKNGAPSKVRRGSIRDGTAARRLHLTPHDQEAREHSPSRLESGRCVCERCTCTLHHCPHHRPRQEKRAHIPFNGESGQHRDFRAYNANEMKAAWLPITANASLESGQSSLNHNKTHFHGTTTYHHDYTEKEIPFSPSQQYKQEATRHPRLPFEGKSHYTEDYTPKKAERYVPNVSRNNSHQWGSKNVPFQSETTNRCDYTPKRSEPVLMRKLAQETRCRVPFEGETGYKCDFRAYDADEMRGANVVPNGNRRKDAWMPGGKFRGETEMNAQYTPKQADMMRRTMPVSSYMDRPRVPFEGESTHHADYTPKQADRTPMLIHSNKDTYPWDPRRRGTFTTTAHTTYGEGARACMGCPVTKLMQEAPLPSAPPTGREHVYFDDAARTWY